MVGGAPRHEEHIKGAEALGRLRTAALSSPKLSGSTNNKRQKWEEELFEKGKGTNKSWRGTTQKSGRQT